MLTILTILGALGIFLYGMKVMSEGIQKVAGNGMRTALATMTKNRRVQRRHRISPNADVRVEFTYPSPNGRPLSYPVLDISAAGFSFVMDEPIENVEIGLSISDVTVRLGKLEMHGDLIVMHVTHERGVCGALFYPATDEDLIRMKFVMAGIGAIESVG